MDLPDQSFISLTHQCISSMTGWSSDTVSTQQALMKGPKMELNGDDCAAKSIELAEQTCEVPNRQEMPVVFLEGGEDLAPNTAKFVARHTELHLLGVHLGAEELLRP